MTESEWIASEDEDVIDSNDSVWNEELKKWNELLVYDIQLREQVNVESVPAFIGTQRVRGLTRVSALEHFSFLASEYMIWCQKKHWIIQSYILTGVCSICLDPVAGIWQKLCRDQSPCLLEKWEKGYARNIWCNLSIIKIYQIC
jgi:hypothetical protein